MPQKFSTTTFASKAFGAAVALGVLAGAMASASAETYPSRPVRIIVPYGAGGIADVTMRMVAEKMSQKLGERFIIENRPGAGGVLGMQATLTAPADGYTLTMIGGGLTVAKAIFNSLPYDIEKDVTPITTTASYGLVITTKAGSPYKTLADVIAAAKANPGKLNFGTINAGSAQNLSGVLFKSAAGIDVAVVPFKTTPDLATAVLRGDIDVAFEYYAGFQSSIEGKQMTVLATTGPERASNLPDVPTVIESGIKDYNVTSWNGLAAKTGTPAEVIKIINRAVDEALKSPDIQKYSTNAGMEARGMTPDALQARIKSDVAKWTQVIEKAGIPKQ